ncbi:MAG: putative zinc-binding protein [Deferrisomatales bacterium]
MSHATCACEAAPTLIFPCSGAADVGEIADRAGRELTRRGIGKMFCLAGVGGRVSGIMASTRAAAKVVAIDGCPLACASKTLEQAGFSGFSCVSLADLGLIKGKSPVCEQALERVIGAVADVLCRGENVPRTG